LKDKGSEILSRCRRQARIETTSNPCGDAGWRGKGLALLHALQHNEYAGCTALTADTAQHRESLLAAGADVVLLPFRDAAAEAADMLAANSETRQE
jgi:hypothetical protein